MASARFVCTICAKSFNQRQGLARHKNAIHSGARRCFPCRTCDKIFSRLDALLRHKRNSSTKPDKCSAREIELGWNLKNVCLLCGYLDEICDCHMIDSSAGSLAPSSDTPTVFNENLTRINEGPRVFKENLTKINQTPVAPNVGLCICLECGTCFDDAIDYIRHECY